MPAESHLPHVPRTVSVLIDHLDYLHGGYSSQVQRGLEEAARSYGVKLNYFVGHELESGPEAELFRLADSDNSHAIIALTAGLATYTGVEGVTKLLEPLKRLPLCSLGVELEGIPSVVADNRPGQEAIIDHLIVDHKRRRIACLAGHQANPDSLVRFQVYREALERHGIPFDPELVFYGISETTRGKRATEELLARGTRFDAIIAVNDGVALGALEALTEHGLRVPQEVALTGFDDLTICRFTRPPLSTVRQPVVAMAQKAVELVKLALDGGEPPLLTKLSVTPVLRGSCGCQAALAPLSTRFGQTARVDLPEWLEAQRSSIAARLHKSLDAPDPAGAAWVDAALDALSDELSGERGAFVLTLEQHMTSASDRFRAYDESLRVIEALRRSFDPVAKHLDALWMDAERALAIASVAAQMQNWVAVEAAHHSLLGSGAGFSRAFDWTSLKLSLKQFLPEQITSAYVSLRLGDTDDWLQPFFCSCHGQMLESNLQRFPAKQLVPPDIPSARGSESWIVLPLTVEDEYLGIMVLELSGRVGIHEMVRSQISTALKSVSLHQRIVQKTAEHERSVQQRLATTKRLQSLSVLAGGVAHDLNNALGPLVALPDVILDQLRSGELGDPGIEADLDLLKGSALRAAQTIKDLFALGRQGRMPKQPLDLNRFCKTCIEADHALNELVRRHHAQLCLKTSPNKLMVSASEGQLQRALSNLLRNAVEALPEGGAVTLETKALDLQHSLDAYETIAAGSYAVIEVHDTGRGIDRADLGRIFEPFFTNKPASESSGSGLGLAIVHGVVKEHDGYVHVESDVGKGTTFRLYLPRTQRIAETRPARARLTRGGGSILAIDDDPVQLRTAKRVLTHYGYEIVVATNAAEARRCFATALKPSSERDPFDLVLVDMVLGEPEDGLQLFASLQQLRPEQRGLLVSGNAPTERVEDAMQKGLCFLAKPYRSDELVEAVQAALDSAAARSLRA